MKKFRRHPDLGLFLIRLALAVVFIAHGWSKLQDLPGTVGFFDNLGFGFLAYPVTAIELLGGLAMLFGVFTGWAGALLAAVMVGAIATVKGQTGFFGGYEFDLTLLLAALGIAFTGPGRHALGRKARE